MLSRLVCIFADTTRSTFLTAATHVGPIVCPVGSTVGTACGSGPCLGAVPDWYQAGYCSTYVQYVVESAYVRRTSQTYVSFTQHWARVLPLPHSLHAPPHAAFACILKKNTQTKNGTEKLNVRENKLARFDESGEVGYWKVERRPIPGAPKRKIPLLNEAMDVLVLDIPEQGQRRDLIVSYEVRFCWGLLVIGGHCCICSVGGADRIVAACAHHVCVGFVFVREPCASLSFSWRGELLLRACASALWSFAVYV